MGLVHTTRSIFKYFELYYMFLQMVQKGIVDHGMLHSIVDQADSILMLPSSNSVIKIAEVPSRTNSQPRVEEVD